MENAINNLMELATDNLTKEERTYLTSLEASLDFDDTKAEELIAIEEIFFKFGLRAGIKLSEELKEIK